MSILELTSIYNHWLTIYSSTMIYSWHNIYTFRFNNVIWVLSRIKNQNLIYTFSQLSFFIKHIAATKSINFTVISNWTMTTSARDIFVWLKLNILPFRKTRISRSKSIIKLSYFFISIIILTSNQNYFISNTCQSWIFSRSRKPVSLLYFSKFDKKRFFFLNFLNICLQSSSPFFCKSISWYFFWRLSSK